LIIEYIKDFLWNLLTLLRIAGAGAILAPCFFIHGRYFEK